MYSERLKHLEFRLVQDGSLPSNVVNSETEEHHEESLDEKSIVAGNDINPALTGFGIGFASMLMEILLSHPFVVIRNQCQVMGSRQCHHLTPFTLLPVVRKCIQSQGFSFLSKGLGSVFIVRGLNYMTENLVCEITSLPKEVSRSSSYKRLLGHLLLKVCSWVIVTPFYAASIVEVVQSDKASEPATLISCVRDGFYRLFHMPSSPRLGSRGSMFRSGPTVRGIPIATSRLLPVWRLFPPVVILNVGHYIVRSFASIVSVSYWNGYDDRLERDAEIDLSNKTGVFSQNKFSPGYATHYSTPSINAPSASERHTTDMATLAYQRQDTALQAIYNRYYTDLLVGMTANFAADVILYPVETLVLRLCVQGTRTLVDNMDTGDVVVPIVSSYDGFFDALRSTLDLPVGFLGLYRGFGALVAQYALQALFIFGIRCLYEHLLYLWPPPSTDDKVYVKPGYRPNVTTHSKTLSPLLMMTRKLLIVLRNVLDYKLE
ncbi:unnamed protein product [Heterobilharzia americana]|nr:unnamed protein product [Heterobilharzia americana]